MITFVIPSRNNLSFLKLAYKSIKALGNDHHILILNDASTDGTEEWLHMMLNKFWKEKQEDKTIPLDQVITLDHLTNPDKK